MANRPSYPTNPDLNIHLPTPPLSSNSSAPFTPRSSSIADDSDAEFDPTPIHSPRGGPQYDDLPPSYDEAQHQAVSDARNGVTPLDPNQLEAHRLTLNEGPNEPEVWEYRVRGEDHDVSIESERAPEYDNHTNYMGTTVPILHNGGSENITVGQIGSRNAPPYVAPNPISALLERALSFTHHEPDGDAQYAPRLTRRIAIPQQGVSASQSQPVQFLRAYAKALHAHSIRPAEFAEFLDGLNALCVAANMTAEDLLSGAPMTGATSQIIHDYFAGANVAFFAPRGLRVSIQSLSTLIEAIAIPSERGQRAGAVASVVHQSSTAERKAQALCPWIETLETDVPASSAQSLFLREMGDRLRGQGANHSATDVHLENDYPPEKASQASRGNEHEDPPHSIPEGTWHPDHSSHPGLRDHWGRSRRGFRGRGRHRGCPWASFGAAGHGPFGAPGNGRPSNGPFGSLGQSPFGAPGRGPFSRPIQGSSGSSGCNHYLAAHQSGGARWSQSGNEWAALGKDISKWGEEFGKRMGDWGQEFGKQADVWGQDVERRAATWGEDVSARASGSGNRSDPMRMQADDAMSPSYSDGPIGQETGVLRGGSKSDTNRLKTKEKPLDRKQAKAAKDDGASSFTSDSSDSDSDEESDSDSDENDEDLPDTQAIFLKRVNSINKQAETAASKGKKSREEIAQERALAIEKAQNEKTTMDLKIEEKMSKRAINRELRQKRRDLSKQYRQKKRALKEAHDRKGKGRAKKTPQWKQTKREYRDKKKELRKEKLRAKKEWKEARYKKRAQREGAYSDSSQQDMMSRMVWVVVENLDS